MTKRQQLRSDLTTSQNDLQLAMGILDNMRTGTDLEATESLARLRIGSSLESEYHRIQANRPQGADSSSSTSGLSRRTQQITTEADESAALYLENQRLLNLLSPRSQQMQQMQQMAQQPEQQMWAVDPAMTDGWQPPGNEGWSSQHEPIDPHIQTQQQGNMDPQYQSPSSDHQWPDAGGDGHYGQSRHQG